RHASPLFNTELPVDAKSWLCIGSPLTSNVPPEHGRCLRFLLRAVTALPSQDQHIALAILYYFVTLIDQLETTAYFPAVAAFTQFGRQNGQFQMNGVIYQ